ncbi:hypothetical protein ACFL6Y_09850 [Elusimicrobiota bacterium]
MSSVYLRTDKSTVALIVVTINEVRIRRRLPYGEYHRAASLKTCDYQTKKATGLLLLFFFFGISVACSYELTFSEKLGKSNVSHIIEEEEDRENFSFNELKVGLNKEQEDRAKFSCKASSKRRKYDLRSSDYSMNRFSAGYWRRIDFHGGKPRIGTDAGWRNKDFEKQSLSDYKTGRIAFFAENFKGWGSRISVSDHNYDSGRYESKVTGRINKKLKFEDMDISGLLRAQHHDFDSGPRWQRKHEAALSFGLNTKQTYLDRMSFRVETGQRDAKEDLNRDDNADFSFWNAIARTKHSARSGLKFSTEIAKKKKKDRQKIFTHDGTLAKLRCTWKTMFLNRIFNITGITGFKRMSYEHRSVLDYNKNTIGADVSFDLEGWKAMAKTKFDFYDLKGKGRKNTKILGEIAFARNISKEMFLKVANQWHGSLVSLGIEIKYRI